MAFPHFEMSFRRKRYDFPAMWLSRWTNPNTSGPTWRRVRWPAPSLGNVGPHLKVLYNLCFFSCMFSWWFRIPHDFWVPKVFVRISNSWLATCGCTSSRLVEPVMLTWTLGWHDGSSQVHETFWVKGSLHIRSQPPQKPMHGLTWHCGIWLIQNWAPQDYNAAKMNGVS